MIIPKFLKENDTIGITACSNGVFDKLEKYENSIQNVKNQGFNIIETNNVRTSGVVSSDSITRAKELNELVINPDVQCISIASGGDFLYDMLPYVDFKSIQENVKWICGSSDPTSLLFTITTNYNIQTIYTPCNMSGFNGEMHPSLIQYFEILKGERKVQHKFDYCEGKSFSDVFDKKNEWIHINGDVDEKGVLIGGCLECIKDTIGTKFDHVKEFISQFDSMIWYFDVFNMTAEGVYLTMNQFKNAGWFDNTSAILFGRVAFPNTFVDMTYEELLKQAFPNQKVIFNMDIGHVKPSFTLINGAKAHIVSNDKENYLEFE